MTWAPPDLKADPEINAIFEQTIGYVCDKLDKQIETLRGRSTPEADLYVVALEDQRNVLASVRQGMLDMAVLAAQRAGGQPNVNLDRTAQSVIDRRNLYEKRRRERLAMLPEDHPCAPFHWRK